MGKKSEVDSTSRKGAVYSNSLSPLDQTGPSPSATHFPRSSSPSNFTQFFSKSSKWFSRSASTSKVYPSGSGDSPRTSTSSARRHKISHPTDPRPILDCYNASAASRSVLDLSARAQGSFEISSRPSSPAISSTQAHPSLGDLRAISRKGWSKSADDLSRISTTPTHLSPTSSLFQDKIAEYRGRCDSGPNGGTSVPSSPVSHTGRHPFPSVNNTRAGPPEVSVISPRKGSLPTVSISISAPVIDENTSTASSKATSAHLHTRSHSFTPKVASKLASPLSVPTSGKRKGSGSDSDKNPSPFNVRNGISGTSFPFGFGTGGGHKQFPSEREPTPPIHALPSISPTTLLAPPSIEPTMNPNVSQSSNLTDKRLSQIVYHSGFLNRLADSPNSHYMALAKGWKPFKAELKGSKLYLWKPPSASSGIKDLFPTVLVPTTMEEEDNGEGEVATAGDEGASKRGREEVAGRKRRAFWGRRTHPGLVRTGDNLGVEKGSFEALVHEVAFGTVFGLCQNPKHQADEMDIDQESPQSDENKCQMEAWRTFASSVILCLPFIMGYDKFEAEFLRCCSFLVSGAQDDTRDAECERVAWLAREYLRYHGAPIDPNAWEEWRKETIPNMMLQDAAAGSMMPMSTSMQAIHPSPLMQSSPNVGVFSPRPGESTGAGSGSLAAALKEGGVMLSPKKGDTPSRTMVWGAALQQEGLSREVLRMLDPHLIAHSLSVFHRSVMNQLPDNLTAGYVVEPVEPTYEAPVSGPFLLLSGTEDQPHWLTKFILLQALGAETSQHSDHRTSRADVVAIWIRVGELCRLGGDECSWRAIFHALCSRPMARLDKTWRSVGRIPLAAVESWVYTTSSEQGPLEVKEPKVTLWAGDARARVKEEMCKAIGEDGEGVRVRPLEEVQKLFECFRTTFGLCPRRAPVTDQEAFNPEELNRLMSYWRKMSEEGGGVGSAAAKFQRVEQFMSLSFAVEPRRKGHFEPYFWSKSSPSHNSLLPLLFPESLPTVSMVDRSQLLRGRVDSDASDMGILRGMDNRRLEGRPSNSGVVLGEQGTVIPVYNGELLLVVQNAVPSESSPSSRPASRPSSRPCSSIAESMSDKHLSRTASIRVKPGSSHNLERKSSVARRNSLPSISHRPTLVLSERSSEPPLRVIVRAGTMTNLIQILVFGLQNVSVSVADDNGEMSLREGKTRELVVDRAEFAKVWWYVFRTFISPLVFFEHLRKIYISSQPFGSPPSVQEYTHVVNTRSEVLETMKEWLVIGGGAQDTLDDPQLFQAFSSFLDSSSDHAIYASGSSADPGVQQSLNLLEETKNVLSFTFSAQTLRPLATRESAMRRTTTRKINGSRTQTLANPNPPDFETTTPEDFVENLNGMACALYSRVSKDDLYAASDILEVQSSDRTGWFTTSSREPSVLDDSVDIQTFHSHIMDVESSSLHSTSKQDFIYRLLPATIRSCFRAHLLIRKWIISKIVAPQLGARLREARMELLLKVLELARRRNAASLIDQPCVRSFVEAVVTSAIISAESRAHVRCWQNVAISRGTQCDNLSNLLCRPSSQSAMGLEPLAPDMGWIMERILEVIATPDTVDTGTQDNNLINFDKRRNLYNFLNGALWLPSERRSKRSDELNACAFDRLTRAEEDVSRLQFDLRCIKEEAAKEISSSSLPSTGKKLPRPFQRLVTLQHEKYRRDRNLRSRLQKEKLHEQAKLDKRDEMLNRAMRPRKQGYLPQKQHRNKKSMSAFLHFMRPISSAFGADNQPTSGPKKSAAELDFTPSGKPALVVSLMEARVAQFINNERSYTFQLDTEDGGHYIFQAISKREMNKWISSISRVTNMAAKRRLTYLGSSPKPQIADHIHDPVVASRDPKAVFGVELNFLLQREAGNEAVKPGTIPIIMEKCLTEIEARGLTEVGIYRIAGAVSEINAIKDAFNRGECPISHSNDIHAVCDLVKAWFRLLPEPIFPSTSYHDVIRAMHTENLDSRLCNIRNVVHALPQANFDLLKRVSEHLDKVTDFEEQNHMTAEALAIVFSPNLLRAPQNDFAMIISNMGYTHKLVKAFITHFHVIFDDTDLEVEVPSDDDEEYDSPILEEDEEGEESLSTPPPQLPELDAISSIHHDDVELNTPN